jgi:hypothetical protein
MTLASPKVPDRVERGGSEAVGARGRDRSGSLAERSRLVGGDEGGDGPARRKGNM